MAEKDIITMTQKELKRLHIIKQVLEKKLKQIEAARLLDLSSRQIRRLVKKVGEEGDKGIIHRSRGQPSHRRLPERIKNRVIALYRKRYKGFGPTLASEKLLEIDKIKISDETLRLWLIEKGEWQKHCKRKKHRSWRQRKHYFGEMVQMDGSHHDWFEGRGPKCVLMGYIDDATSIRFARFYAYEGTIPAFDSLKHYIKRYGIPKSLYLDKHTTYKSTAKPTIEDELNNRRYLSQFERAAHQLSIEIIHANSPQAKGRIERSFKTYQDRLIKEMRLRGISTIEEANKFLKEFLPKHNKRFSLKPTKEGNLHRPLPKSIDLDAILCIKTEHPVRGDFTIVHNKKLYQILDKTIARKVTVQERINGKVHIVYKGRRLRYKVITTRPPKEKPKPKPRKIYRPPLEHPWKRPLYERRLAKEKALLQSKKDTEELALVKV